MKVVAETKVFDRYMVSDWLRRAASMRGIPMADIAKEIGVSSSEMRKFTKTRGRGAPVIPDSETLDKIADVLEVEREIVRDIAERSRE